MKKSIMSYLFRCWIGLLFVSTSLSVSSFMIHPPVRGGGGGGGGSSSSSSTRNYKVLTKALSSKNNDNYNNMAVSQVAVVGATGRTGRLVVQELLNRGVSVTAMVRNMDKAKKVFSNQSNDDSIDCETSLLDNDNMKVVQVDLADLTDIQNCLTGCQAVIWCATGFSDNSQVDIVERFRRLFGIAFKPKQSVDAIGIPNIAQSMVNANGAIPRNDLPKVIMLSSAGVTRPSWPEKKKEKLRGCADIPIVRLNPFGILDVKKDSEELLRKCGVNYCIVRPAGLNDKWPAGSRPIISQGDVAVGRINRQDVANILVDVLSIPEASGKTFEVFTLANYVPPRSIVPTLSKLKLDNEPISEEAVELTYNIIQQTLPGETQDAAALAMGQTYEQLDKGETGRLGKRGREDAEAAAPKPSPVA